MAFPAATCPRIRSAQEGKLRTTDSKHDPATPPTSASRPAVGRRVRSLARQRSISGRASVGSRPGWGAMYHAVHQRRRGPGAERALARGGEGEDRPQAEDVARRPDFVSR